MSVITIRVDESTKKAMRALSVNWSQVLRQRIRQLIEEENRKNRVQALLATEKLRRKAKGFDSTRAVRFWRKRRYGKVGG